MDILTQNLNLLAQIGSALALFYFLKNESTKKAAAVKVSLDEFKAETKERFEKVDAKLSKIDEKIDRILDKLDSLKDDIHDLRERIVTVEADAYIMNVVPQNQRSEAAKRMWERRKSARKPKLTQKG